MRKLLTLSLLLFSFNGWTQSFSYDGNDYDECVSVAADFANNDEEYSDYLDTCRFIDYQSINEEKRRREAERKEKEERQSVINEGIITYLSSLEPFSYDGNDYDECLQRISEYASNNKSANKTYSQYLEVCRTMESERIIADLRERCVSYGFTGDNNIAACVQREAQHKLELAEKENESREIIKLAVQQSSNQSRQTQRQSNAEQQADAKRQREAQALINLGALISGAGSTNNTNRATPRINSNPNNFSTTLTVPSNQNCPLKNTPLTKQEVRGSNRICYYQ